MLTCLTLIRKSGICVPLTTWPKVMEVNKLHWKSFQWNYFFFRGTAKQVLKHFIRSGPVWPKYPTLLSVLVFLQFLNNFFFSHLIGLTGHQGLHSCWSSQRTLAHKQSCVLCNLRNFLLHSTCHNHRPSWLATKPWCIGSVTAMLRWLLWALQKWKKTPALEWHLCMSSPARRSQLWSTHQSQRAGQGASPSCDPSAWHLTGVVMVGSTEYPNAGWLPQILHPPRMKGDPAIAIAMLLASVSMSYEADRRVQKHPVWADTSSCWLVTFSLHLHNQSAYCIGFDWRGFNCNLKIWPFQEFLK